MCPQNMRTNTHGEPGRNKQHVYFRAVGGANKPALVFPRPLVDWRIFQPFEYLKRTKKRSLSDFYSLFFIPHKKIGNYR